jgi:hypothetical protein
VHQVGDQPRLSNMQLRKRQAGFLSEQQICCMLILICEFCGPCMNCRRLLSLYWKTNTMYTIQCFNLKKNPKFEASLAHYQAVQLYKTIARLSLHGTVVRSSMYDVQRWICTQMLEQHIHWSVPHTVVLTWSTTAFHWMVHSFFRLTAVTVCASQLN